MKINKETKNNNEKLIVFDKLIFPNISLVNNFRNKERKNYEKSSLIIFSKLLERIGTNNKSKIQIGLRTSDIL